MLGELSERLHSVIAAVCPINGVSIGTVGDIATVRIDFQESATAQQQTNAQSALTAFDWSQAAQDSWEDNRNPDRKTLRDTAAQAISDIDTYLAIGNPSNAQNLAQIRLLSQISKRLIKRLVQID